MDIFKSFRDAGNTALAASMSKYMRDQFPFLGIQKPERTKLSREFLKAKSRWAHRALCQQGHQMEPEGLQQDESWLGK